MPSKNSEAGTKRTNDKAPKNKKNTSANKANDAKNSGDRHKMIAAAAYFRAEKRGFKGNGADTVQDWLEAEVEIDHK